jgi:hypothetical protein
MLHCVICDKLRNRKPTGWCESCTLEYLTVLNSVYPNRKPRYAEPTPASPLDDPKTFLRENLP